MNFNWLNSIYLVIRMSKCDCLNQLNWHFGDMTKYKIYLKGGTVLEVEAEGVQSNATQFHFYGEKEDGVLPMASFNKEEVYGFCKSERVKQANEHVRSIKLKSAKQRGLQALVVLKLSAS